MEWTNEWPAATEPENWFTELNYQWQRIGLVERGPKSVLERVKHFGGHETLHLPELETSPCFKF